MTGVPQNDHHRSSNPTVPIRSPQTFDRGTNLQFLQRDTEYRRFLHNHPSGDPTPSQTDIQMTRAIVDIANPLGISVHDHIIVGKNGHASMKGLKLI